jgi:RNA polymerase sigma-70 factor (ECF subfamily)
MNSIEIEEIVKKYSDMLYRLAFARTGNSHDSEDIVQEVFLKLVRGGKTFKDDEHQKAWLIRVTVNAGKNLNLSAFKRKNAGELKDYENRADYSAQKEDKTFSQLETKAVVYPAVLSLPEKYRIVVHLFYYEEMQIPEICKVTGLGTNTVKSRLHRARNLLREKLKEVDFNEN